MIAGDLSQVGSGDGCGPFREVCAMWRRTPPGPAGRFAANAGDAAERAIGKSVRAEPECGMGWEPARLLDPEFLILSTHGGMRAEDGTPIALGFHTGHWEVGLLVAEAARELKALHAMPFAGACTDPCDGRTQGTTGMMDSLPYRNDAAMVLRRLMRSLPTRQRRAGRGDLRQGTARDDDGAGFGGCDCPAVLVPGGVTLLPEDGEDAGKVQTIGARFAQQQITLEYAAEVGCRACASPGGGCQFLGTAATAQVVGEALGLVAAAYGAGAFRAADLAGCGDAIGARDACGCMQLELGARDVLTRCRGAQCDGAACGVWRIDESAAASAGDCIFGGIEAAHAWRTGTRVNRSVPRLVDALPNGPRGFRDGAGISRRRRAGGDAAAARGGAAGYERADSERRDARCEPRLVGAERAAADAARAG